MDKFTIIEGVEVVKPNPFESETLDILGKNGELLYRTHNCYTEPGEHGIEAQTVIECVLSPLAAAFEVTPQRKRETCATWESSLTIDGFIITWGPYINDEHGHPWGYFGLSVAHENKGVILDFDVHLEWGKVKTRDDGTSFLCMGGQFEQYDALRDEFEVIVETISELIRHLREAPADDS